MNEIPTIRSNYSIEQFEKVLQKRAHEIALIAVTNLDYGSVEIKIMGKRCENCGKSKTCTCGGKMISNFTYVDVGQYTLKFYTGHLSYNVHPSSNHRRWWGFDAEQKSYLTSNHKTKISVWAKQGEEKEVKKEIMAFIDKLMAAEGLKPEPRFKLQDRKAA